MSLLASGLFSLTVAQFVGAMAVFWWRGVGKELTAFDRGTPFSWWLDGFGFRSRGAVALGRIWIAGLLFLVWFLMTGSVIVGLIWHRLR